MANPLRKTMVYLGLADEDYEYEQEGPVGPAAPVAPASSSPSAARAQVTPLRRASRSAAPEMNEILTVRPRQYKDAQLIAENYREGIPVIIDLTQMSEQDARRLIDFASGLSQGLYGKIERVTSKVFLLSPSYVEVRGDHSEVDADVDASFFAQG
ncbi:cell division inhibitor SepF [Microbacteriaceae bacterium SG_E_30_P1]|uniref:Cell division protein SepF n=1 Tax=Antiquaquibacter oligotrophicus TaxID=2880260 RepID=A0ABT6KLD1_9MICO|nr:cell division protein SepF [Antiquaquibacter oligotrophicus]MDH6180825.1 cell division inhibitor SepF [Antiquaquibacter oligotrophicus]UDF13459.1 cell division protein SepF [Antiquaquibacter oligotrophicus]